MTSDLRVACVGAGYFSRFHTDSWQRMLGAALVGVCDLDLDKARATGVAAFDDLAAMLGKVQPDIVDIILPPYAQADAIDIALDAKPSAIICQKPFCKSLKEAAAVTSRANEAGVPLIVHENFRFQPWYRLIKNVMDRGEIGAVRQVGFRLRPGDGQGHDAYLDRQPYFRRMPRLLVHETGVHFLDVFRYLLGPVSHIYADLRQENPVLIGEDAGVLLLDHKAGARSVFDGNRCLDHSADNTRRTMGEGLIEGTAGTLTLTGYGAVHLRKFGAMAGRQILGPDTFEGFGGDCTHALQSHVIAHFHHDMPLENTATDYLTVRHMEEAAYQSAALGRKIAL
ncbi:MAG: Gfo/Idh/MocA family oxidoreductase [Pseudomonadota bacterium]